MSNRSDVDVTGAGVTGGRAPDAGVTGDGIADLADIFSLLGDPSRLRLLFALRAGEVSVGELSARTGQSDSAVSHALQLLRAHRIVRVRREGRRAFYRLDDPHVRMLLEVALTHTEHSELRHPERRTVDAPQERAGSPHEPAGRASS